ncbi:dynein heavy chain 2, axonemal-like [Python bivittatus]|uniref:Dynein heavy chain 2, axonemal-like n=1 Tax=Python bivittatus TaxID=176946 RepID=A0A9F5MRU6_PYTBI|nr:dynein heavy chain 2, axonemal-like [Python bivittatus]
MSTDLEEIFNCIFDARVPPMWERAYPSQKPLAAWTRDLGQRVEQFGRWAKTAHPPVLFWLSGFTFPTGFLTAVLQAAARQNNISVDTLSWEFIVSTVDDNNLVYPPKEGVWVRGLCLEGAGWDKKNSCLGGIYSCPCYYYPNRAGTSGRPSFVIGVDLRSGAMTPDHWIKRGTALLMSLDTVPRGHCLAPHLPSKTGDSFLRSHHVTVLHVVCEIESECGTVGSPCLAKK